MKLVDEDGKPVVDKDGNEITAKTDKDGNYTFEDVAPGDYKIVSAKPPSGGFLYLDVSGEGIKNGTNVQVWTGNAGYAQDFTISYRANGTTRLLNRRCGKSVDITSAKIEAGTNVQLYSHNATRAQEWDLVPDGGTAVFNSQSYPTYIIQPTADHGLAIGFPSNGASGADVKLYKADSSVTQRWMLVPIENFVSGGLYEIRSMLKASAALDVSGNSSTNGANVQLYQANGTNAQKFYLTEETSDHWSIQHYGTNMYVDVKGAGTSPGTNVQQYADNDTRAQRWLVEQYERTTVEGESCAVVTFGSYVAGEGLTLFMDAQKGLTSNNANVVIEENRPFPRYEQRWALLPTSPKDTMLPSPANVGWAASVGDPDSTRIRPEAMTYYPTWATTMQWAADSANHHEVRWRTRSLVGSTWTAFSAWTSWETIDEEVDGQRRWMVDGLQANVPSGSKALQYEIQVRAAGLDANGNFAVGEATSATLQADQVPNVTLTAVGYGPDGLRIAYSSDYDGGTNNIQLQSIKMGDRELLANVVNRIGLPATGTIILDPSELAFVPEDGISTIISYRVGTDFHPAFYDPCLYSTVISYDSGSGLTVAPMVKANNGYTVDVSLSGGTATKAWVVHDGETTEMPVTNGVASICPPFGDTGAYEVWLLAESGDDWAITHVSADSMAAAMGQWEPCHVWNWPGGFFVLQVRKDKLTATDYTVKRNYAAFQLNDRAWDSVHYQATRSATLKAEGVLTAHLDLQSTSAELDALCEQGYATYRGPDGIVANVAITSYRIVDDNFLAEVSVDMVRVTN